MSKLLLLSTLLFFGLHNLQAQVKIGSAGTPNTNAVLELDGGTSKGLLLPKLTATEITALTTAPDGLIVYNKTDNFLYIRKSATWQKVSDGTNGGGGLTLPYAGTASTVGGAEFSITHTSTFGDAAYFNNTAGGDAVTSGAGNNKFNIISGNTGIGIPAGLLESPKLGKLVVRGTVGAVSAMFGDNTSGVSVMNNFPSIGFNYYYNAGSKAISTGYGSALGQDPSTGRIYLSSSSASVSGAGTAMPLVDRLVVLANGNTGIATANSVATLTVGRGSTTGGTAQFDGTSNSSHFNYSTTEDTYIRGGKATSQVLVNDVSSGNVRLAEGGGNVGIGIAMPTRPLSFPAATGKKISLYPGATGDAGFGIFPNELRINSDNVNADITFGYDNFTNDFSEKMRIKGNGNVGIGVNAPSSRLDMLGRMRVRGTLNDGVNTAGIYFDGVSTAQRSFIGTFNENTFGLYGSTVGWNFLMDVNDGAIMIGTSQKAAGYKVNVAGKIIAEEVRVQLRGAWPDYVFDDQYKKLSLDELEKYLAVNKHLPNIPSAADIEKDGQQLGEVQRKMLEKIEEMSLYIIELKKEINEMKQQKSNN